MTSPITILSCNREGEALGSVGARLAAAVGVIAVAVGCEQDSGSRRAVPSYDVFSGRLVQLSADQNGDGRIDQGRISTAIVPCAAKRISMPTAASIGGNTSTRRRRWS